MKKYLAMFAFIIVGMGVKAQIQSDVEAAFKRADALNRPVFLIFSGSDWCAPCVEFERSIVQQDAFKQFAEASLVVLKADFPQRAILSPEIQAQNDMLASLYNPKGVFPLLLLIRSDRSLIGAVPYTNQQPEVFVSQLRTLLPPTP